MGGFKLIHIWDFPPTFSIQLEDTFREAFFDVIITKLGSQQAVANYINKRAKNYKLQRKYLHGHVYAWIRGKKLDRGEMKNVYIPLWVLKELSIFISHCKSVDNVIMRKIESHILSYSIGGKSIPITSPILPVKFTPELVSVIFHFLGDGHVGRKGVTSSYRQMNKDGLNNMLVKLRSCFGEFKYDRKEFQNGKLVIPKAITTFYVHFFALPSTNTFESYVPHNIKDLPRKFLIAGLLSFIVDEGHIGDVITIYSKNKRLLSDIREMGQKCGYHCNPLYEKYARGKLDCYRFGISSRSASLLATDIACLSAKFSSCTLVQKQQKLMKIL
jgi:hypothetical protein